MAPHYAPSLRSRLAPLLLLLQTGFIVIYALYVELDPHIRTDEATFKHLYSEFQDVNAIAILGFGFLGSFLVRYGFSGSGFNLLVAAMATQWSVILNGFETWIDRGKIRLDLRSLVVAEMCTASALISMGAVLGKTNPAQLLLIALLEVTGFVLNGWLLRMFLKVPFLSCIMHLHTFGAFFGLMLTWVLSREGSDNRHLEKEKTGGKTGLFSWLGNAFLWMFWPSFNSVLIDDPYLRRKPGAIYSTYLALAVSAVTAAAMSALTSPGGKFNTNHMQRCSLAGGVAIGLCVSVVHAPWVAMTIGLAAAVISTLGFRYLKLHMQDAFDCHDTCAVLSVHGLPGLLGWLAHLLLQMTQSQGLTMIIRFAVFHIATLLITLSLSMAMGLITGLLLRWAFCRPPQDRKCFDDQAFWEFPHLAERK